MASIKKVKLSDTVIEEVLKALETGRFKPGEKLPSESVLTKEFGVSRTTLREAFQKLELLGKMSIRQGDGTYVNEEQQPLNIYNHINSAFTFGDTNIIKLLEARECLETYAVKMAVVRATAEDIAGLYKIIDSQKDNLTNPILFAEQDFLFHQRLVELSDNTIILNFWISLAPVIKEELNRLIPLPGVILQAWESHRDIVTFFEQRNAKKAQVSLHQHISSLPGLALSDVSHRIRNENDK